jgi:hypothetical protein
MLRLFDESIDNPAERQQALIDHARFPGALVLGT